MVADQTVRMVSGTTWCERTSRRRPDVGAGPFAIVVRGLPEDEREVLRARLREAFIPFTAGGGYELPGIALCTVAS